MKNFQAQSPISLPISVCDSLMFMACFGREFNEQRNKKRRSAVKSVEETQINIVFGDHIVF